MPDPDLSQPNPDIDGMLDVVRTHLGMDVAFLAQVHDGQRTFTHLSTSAEEADIRVGVSHPAGDTLCTRVLAEPRGLRADDAAAHPDLRDIPLTQELGIRAYAGVPVRLEDGAVFGTLCAFARRPHGFTEEDLHALHLAAGLVAHRLRATGWPPGGVEGSTATRSDAPVYDGTLRIVFQPVMDLRSRAIVGHEALARFAHEEISKPEDWFRMGRRMGLDLALQHRAAARAMDRLDEIPEGQFLSLNLSDAALEEEPIRQLLGGTAPGRLVIELTEHDLPSDAEGIEVALAELREAGVRVALDDVGAGYSGLGRVLRLSPEFIKLDRGLVVGVWDDPRRQAMVQAFSTFARAVGCTVVAEGIESARDADALRILGVTHGQGFFLGVPAPSPVAAT